MSEQQPKKYVGSGWSKEFSNGGSIINLSLNITKIMNEVETTTDKNGNHWIKLTVGKLKTPNEKSKATHSVYEDTFKKDQSNNQPSPF
jgi:hypothetical protein